MRRCREVAAAAERGAAVRGRRRRGCPRGTGGLRGHPRYACSALIPSRAPAEGRGDAPRSAFPGACTWLESRHGHGWVRLCWLPLPAVLHGWEFPAALASSPSRNICRSRGCKQHFFFSLQSLPGPCESPALSVAFFRCSWIVRFPTPLQHPDGALPGGHGEPATAAARGSPPPDAGGHSFGRVGIHPFVTRALVPPVRCARHYGWLPCRT